MPEQWQRVVTLLTLLIALAACGSDSGPSPHPSATPVPTPDESGNGGVATRSPTVVRLEREYEALASAQQAIADVWESLAAGEQVRCGNYPLAPEPDAISTQGEPQYEHLATLLRRAAIGVEEAVNLWRAECQNPRAVPSAATVHQGRLAARAAGDALSEARSLLDELGP